MNTALVYALMAAGALLFQPDAEYPFIPVQLVDQLLVGRTLFQTLTVPLDTSQPPTLPWLEANNLYVVRTDLEARDPMSSAELVGPLRSGLGSQGRTEYHLVGEGAILRVKRVGASESRVSRLTYEGQVARWHDVSNVREINEPRVMSPDRRYLAYKQADRVVVLDTIALRDVGDLWLSSVLADVWERDDLRESRIFLPCGLRFVIVNPPWYQSMKTFRWGEEALPRGKTLLVLERDGPTVVIRAPDDASFSDYYGALVDGSGILLSSLKIDGTECVLQDLQRKNVYRIPLRLGEGIRGVQEVCGRPQVAIFGKRTENRRFDLFGDLRVVIWDFQNNTNRVYDLEVDALFCIREGEFVPRAKVKVVPVE